MRAALALAALVACLLAAGCGDGEGTAATQTTISASAPIQTGSAPTTTADEAPTDLPDSYPDDTLRAFYDHVDAGELDEAWALLAPAVREQLGGFETWSAGVATRESSELGSVVPAPGSIDEPTLVGELRTVEETPCDISAERTYYGSWELRPHGDGWRITGQDLRLVSGPPDLETVCATSGY